MLVSNKIICLKLSGLQIKNLASGTSGGKEMIINEWYIMSCIVLIAVTMIGGLSLLVYGFILSADKKNKNKIGYFYFCFGIVLLILVYGTLEFLTAALSQM